MIYLLTLYTLNALARFCSSSSDFVEISDKHCESSDNSQHHEGKLSLCGIYRELNRLLHELNCINKVNRREVDHSDSHFGVINKGQLYTQIFDLLCIAKQFIPLNLDSIYTRALNKGRYIECYEILSSLCGDSDHYTINTFIGFRYNSEHIVQSVSYHKDIPKKHNASLTFINSSTREFNTIDVNTISKTEVNFETPLFIPTQLLDTNQFGRTSTLFDYKVFSYLLHFYLRGCKHDSKDSISDILRKFLLTATTCNLKAIRRSKIIIICLISAIIQKLDFEIFIRWVNCILKSEERGDIYDAAHFFYFPETRVSNHESFE